MPEGTPSYEARALLAQFRRSSLRSCHVRTAGLELFASRDAALRYADIGGSRAPAADVAPMADGTYDCLAPHVGTVARLAAIGSTVAAGEAYGALAVLDEERPLLADRAGTIVAHHRAPGDLVEGGERVAALADRR